MTRAQGALSGDGVVEGVILYTRLTPLRRLVSGRPLRFRAYLGMTHRRGMTRWRRYRTNVANLQAANDGEIVLAWEMSSLDTERAWDGSTVASATVSPSNDMNSTTYASASA